MKIEELLSKQSYLKQRLSKYRKSLPFEDALNFGFKWCYVKRSRDVVMPHIRKLSLMKFTISLVLYIPRAKMEIVMIAF